MTKHYSKSTGGFYDDTIHGARKFSILDPDWVRPNVDVELAPGESWGTTTNTTGGPLLLTEVPDLLAVHPSVLVDNPACKIPADAVEVSAEHYELLFAGQAVGKRIVGDANGVPVLIDPPAETVSQAAARLERALDRHIDAAAQGRNWRSIDSARAAAGYVNPWQAEGLLWAQWHTDCWSTSITIQAAVLAGERPIPTEVELLAEMPPAPTFE